MSYVVAIEIADIECRAAIAEQAGLPSSDAETIMLNSVPVKGPEFIFNSGRVSIQSVHSRLNPRVAGSGTELLDRFRFIYEQATSKAGSGEKLLAMAAIPGAYSATQRELVRNLLLNAGFSGAGLVDASVAAALGTQGTERQVTTVLSICATTGSFMAAVVDVSSSVCKARSLEVTSSCGIGGFELGGWRALANSITDAATLARLRGAEGRILLARAIEQMLRAPEPFRDSTLVLDEGVAISVAEDSLRTYLKPVLDEFETHIREATDGFVPESVYVSPPLDSWPMIMQSIGALLPGLGIAHGPNAVIEGALRFGWMSPPEVSEAPPPKIHELSIASGSTEDAVIEEIERLREREAELKTEIREIRSRLANECDRASKMYRSQRRLLEAWDYSRMAVRADGGDTSIKKRHGDIALEIVHGYGCRHRFTELFQFIDSMQKTCAAETCSVAKDYADYYRADHLARCTPDVGGAARILAKLCKRRPDWREARELHKRLSGR